MVSSKDRHYRKTLFSECASLLEHPFFDCFHEFGRTFIRISIVPILRAYFRFWFQADFLIRNSLNSKGKFHLLYSDWDASVVVHDESIIVKVESAYRRLRKCLPSLGELEIYSSESYTQLQRLLREYGDSYAELRRFRKLAHMERKLGHANNMYEINKFKRAIRILNKELAIESPVFYWPGYLRQLLNLCKSLGGEVGNGPCVGQVASDYFLYFDTRIYFQDSCDRPWTVPLQTALPMLRLSPVGKFEHAVLIKWWEEEGRLSKDLSKLRRGLAEIEYIVSIAAGHGDHLLEMGEWPKNLLDHF